MTHHTPLHQLLNAAQAVSEDLKGEVDSHPWSEEYNLEQLAIAARDYVQEVEASGNLPIGW